MGISKPTVSTVGTSRARSRVPEPDVAGEGNARERQAVPIITARKDHTCDNHRHVPYARMAPHTSRLQHAGPDELDPTSRRCASTLPESLEQRTLRYWPLEVG